MKTSLAVFSLAFCAAFARTPENGITAHRGNSLAFPQNSLAAFESACRLGADWVETDVHLTKDGVLVLMHNATTGATCGEERRIAESTYAELCELDIAATFRAHGNLSPEPCPRMRIPRLEEALDLVLREKKARLSIQPKCDCVDAVMALVRAKGALEWVGFNDGNPDYMRRVKELEPSVPVFWDRGGDVNVEADVAFARKYGFETIVPNESGVTKTLIDRLHAEGFKVGAWTVNSGATMKKFLDWGIDRIYTDDPALLKKIKDGKAE